MEDNYRKSRVYLYSKIIFYILLSIYLPTYFHTRWINEQEGGNPTYERLMSFIPVPAHRVKSEAYIMTSDQMAAYLDRNIHPSRIKRDRSLLKTDPLGKYYILFRLNANDHHVDGGNIKCYVTGVKFPIEFEVYTEMRDQYKDYIVPVHVDPNKFKSRPPKIKTRWKNIYRH